jgi:uncharacterized membrane protein
MSLSPRRSLGGAARLRPLVTGAFVVSGATLLYRRLTRRPRAAARRGHLERAITVSRPAGELHRLAAAPDTLPRILQPYLDASVSEDGRLVHLHAPGALRRTLAWQAQVVDDVPGVRRRWRATDGGAPVEVAVSFRPGPGVNDLRVENVPDPTILNPHDAIVRVTMSTTCGSDLHFIDG